MLPTYQDLNRDLLNVIERYAKAHTVEEKVELGGVIKKCSGNPQASAGAGSPISGRN